MALRKSNEKLTKRTMNFYERDIERMEILYPRSGWSVAVRELVHSHVMRVDAETAARMDDKLIEEIEVDLDGEVNS